MFSIIVFEVMLCLLLAQSHASELPQLQQRQTRRARTRQNAFLPLMEQAIRFVNTAYRENEVGKNNESPCAVGNKFIFILSDIRLKDNSRGGVGVGLHGVIYRISRDAADLLSKYSDP